MSEVKLNDFYHLNPRLNILKLQEVFDSFNEQQKILVYILVNEALKGANSL